jgi:hypothetical protein
MNTDIALLLLNDFTIKQLHSCMLVDKSWYESIKASPRLFWYKYGKLRVRVTIADLQRMDNVSVCPACSSCIIIRHAQRILY